MKPTTCISLRPFLIIRFQNRPIRPISRIPLVVALTFAGAAIAGGQSLLNVSYVSTGRLDSGRLRIGSLLLPADSAGDKAVAYVRPHNFEISLEVGDDTLPARVERVRFAGGVVHVELEHEGHPITAALSRQRHRELGLKPGDLVQLQLHEAKVFAEDYSI